MQGRIVHVISTPEGVAGAERVLATIIRASAHAGLQTTVLNPFSSQRSAALRELCLAADPDATFEAIPCSHWVGLSKLRRRMIEELDQARPQIVHAHLFHAAALIASLRSQLESPLVLTHHHGDHNVAERRRLRTRIDKWAGGRFDQVVAISEAVRTFLMENYGYPADKVPLIRNGWAGSPLQLRAPARSKPVIVCTGRLREQKGHATLICAFATVRASFPDARLRLLGDGPLRRRLEQQARLEDVSEAVEFWGDVDDVWEPLSTSSIFCLASNYEPLGIAVLEAMAAGLPVVATDVGGVSGLVRDVGELVPPGDSEAMAQAIVRALGDDDWRAQASKRGRARAATMKADSMTSEYLSLYEALISDGAAPESRTHQSRPALPARP